MQGSGRIREAVHAWTKVGATVVPVKEDGSKKIDLCRWGHLRHHRPTEDTLQHWFFEQERRGLGVICGKASGNIEAIDIEGRADGLYEAFEQECNERALGDLFDRVVDGYFEATPSDGRHIILRVSDGDALPVQKLAYRPATADELSRDPKTKKVLLAETRGEGAYVVVAPSHGPVHAAGMPYWMICGGPDTIASVTVAERDALYDVLRSLDRMPKKEGAKSHSKPSRASESKDETKSTAGHEWEQYNDRPGDDFDRRETCHKVLHALGWTEVKHDGTGTLYHRPGSENGHGAKVWDDDGTCTIFSSTPDVENTGHHRHSPFRLFAWLKHDGDFDAAAADLVEHGYGPQDASTTAVAADGHRLTDTGNAERLVEIAGGKIRYVHAWQKWLVYGGGKWNLDHGDARINELAKQVALALFALLPKTKGKKKREELFRFAHRSESRGAISNMVNLARGNPAVLTDHEDLDANPELLNVLNGTIDLRTGELRAHHPANLITLQADVIYDPKAKAPLWEACLKTWQPNEEIRDYLQREAGAGATGKATETLSLNWGEGGNGKSKHYGAIVYVLGEYACVPHKSLLVAGKYEQHETIKADLFRKRLGVASETKATDALDEEQVKNITGNDRMRARRMREDPWYFNPTHTLVVFTNYKPKITGTDEAIWRRVRLVPWLVTIPEEERDLDLGAKLQAEASGILNWIVQGTRLFLADGFDPPEVIRVATREYRNAQDVIGGFVRARLRFIDASDATYRDTYARSLDLESELGQWAREQGVREADVPGMSQLAAVLKERGYESRRREVNGNRYTVWEGVELVVEQVEETPF